MKILALDTSSFACSVALSVSRSHDSEQVVERHIIAPMKQSSLLLPTIQAVLIEAGLTVSDLDAIAFGAGPGSYTGVRMASSVVKGMALPFSIPVITVSSMAATAQAAYIDKGWKNAIIALDARMDQLFLAFYKVNSAGFSVPVYKEFTFKPKYAVLSDKIEEIKACFGQNDTCYGIGDGWQKYEKHLREQFGGTIGAVQSDIIPTAKAILCLAKNKWYRGERGSVLDANPDYLR